MPKLPLLLTFARVVFFAALIFTFYSAVTPPTDVVRRIPWDKALHFMAFYALTGLAVAAYPRARLWIIAASLSGFGALIEVVQGLPFVHRDEDFWDWVADSIAITAAMAPMLLLWWRQYVGAAQKNSER